MRNAGLNTDRFAVSADELATYMKFGAELDPPHCYAAESTLSLETREWEIGRRVYAAKQLHAYMKARAAAEGVPFDLEESFFAEMVMRGVYHFFGVTLDDGGLDFGLDDECEPSKGFLESWIKKNRRRD